MVSRRKARKGPWLALGAVALLVSCVYFFFIYEPDNAQGNGGAGGDGDVASASSGTNPPTHSGGNGSPSNRGGTPGIDTPRNTGGGAGRETQTNQRETTQREPSHATELIGEARAQYDMGMRLIEEGDLVTGRALLSELLFREEGGLPQHEARAIRERLTHINEQMVLSRELTEGDTIAAYYKVQSGDRLSRIGRSFQTPYQYIMRINGIQDASRLQAGQSIKVIHGPIHARITKHDYRMDLYVDDPDGLPIYLCSYQVGLGQHDSTPVGNWIVEDGGKVENPSWTDPVTNIHYERDDPRVAVGEFWIGLTGADSGDEQGTGYGIHGTIDADSIGQQESRGCIRMADGDIDQVYNMLTDGQSRVEILP